jgi:hypothetical protein
MVRSLSIGSKIFMKKLILIAGLTAALSAPAFATTNLIANGDFTSPKLVIPWGQCASCITGWANAHDNVEIGHNYVYGLPTIGSGVNLEVNANTWGDVTQTVTGLTKGAEYDLSYEYGGRAEGGVQSLDVSFGGKLLTTDTGSIGKWTLNSFTIVAASTSEVLQFKSNVTRGRPGEGNEISTVSLTAVPELSTWAMMLGGFGALGFVGYRRKAASFAA